MKKVITLFIVSIGYFCYASFCFAADKISIESYSYLTHFIAGETVTFTVVLKNNESANKNPYVNIILTNKSTGSEVTPYPDDGPDLITPGGTHSFQATWSAQTGSYSVTIVAYDPADRESDREYGNLPIVISGTSTRESLSVFPTVLDLGTIPNGRYMYPAPIQVSWDFFLFDRLRQAKPWFIRIYTDNATKYKGVPGVLHPISPSGLVSSDGRYTIPLKAWCLNFGPDTEEGGWDSKLQGAPPVDDNIFWLGPLTGDGEHLDEKSVWLRIPDYTEMTADVDTWRKLIGEDITDTQFVSDITADGAFTLDNPFSVYLATDASTTAVKGNYSARIIIELYSP